MHDHAIEGRRSDEFLGWEDDELHRVCMAGEVSKNRLATVNRTDVQTYNVEMPIPSGFRSRNIICRSFEWARKHSPRMLCRQLFRKNEREQRLRWKRLSIHAIFSNTVESHARADYLAGPKVVGRELEIKRNVFILWLNPFFTDLN